MAIAVSVGGQPLDPNNQLNGFWLFATNSLRLHLLLPLLTCARILDPLLRLINILVLLPLLVALSNDRVQGLKRLSAGNQYDRASIVQHE